MVSVARKRRKIAAQLAPAELERLLTDPRSILKTEEDPERCRVLNAILKWHPQHADAEKRRLKLLRKKLYGATAIHGSDQLTPHGDSENGGHAGGICCSHAWADDAWRRGVEYPPPNDLGTAGMFPNNPGRAGVRRCKGCGAFFSRIHLGSSGHCHECRFESDTQLYSRMQSSAGVIDIHQLRGRH